MLFRRTYPELSRDPDLSASEVEALEEIRSHWQRLMNGTPSYHEIIDLALRNMQRDLDSPRRPEVVQDLEREIAYRRWRDTNLSGEVSPARPAEPGRPFPPDSRLA